MRNKKIEQLILRMESHLECWKQFNQYLALARSKKFNSEDENQFLEIKSVLTQELEMILASARVIEDKQKKEKGDLVQVGSTVTIKEDGSKPEQYSIVGAAEANPREGKISNESPIGKAILNHHAGEEVNVEAPGGTFKVKIVKVE